MCKKGAAEIGYADGAPKGLSAGITGYKGLKEPPSSYVWLDVQAAEENGGTVEISEPAVSTASKIVPRVET